MSKKSLFLLLILGLLALACRGANDFNLLTQSFAHSGAIIEEAKIQAWAKLKYPLELEEDMQEFLNAVSRKLVSYDNLEYKLKNTADKQGVILENKYFYATLQTFKSTLETYLLITWDVESDKLADSVLQVKQLFTALEVEPQVAVFLKGTIDKKLEQKEQEQIARQLLQKFGARQVEGISLPEMVSLTGYSPLIKDYLKAGRQKINLNIATTFDEIQNKTIIRLGTPLLNGEY